MQKKSATDAIKTTSKKVVQKTAEATVDFIENKIGDKITRVSKNSPQKIIQKKMKKKYLEKDIYLQN